MLWPAGPGGRLFAEWKFVAKRNRRTMLTANHGDFIFSLKPMKPNFLSTPCLSANLASIFLKESLPKVMAVATASWHFYRERVPLQQNSGNGLTPLQPSNPQDPSDQRHQSSQGTRPSTTSMYQREWRLWKDADLPLSRQCALSSGLFFLGGELKRC